VVGRFARAPPSRALSSPVEPPPSSPHGRHRSSGSHRRGCAACRRRMRRPSSSAASRAPPHLGEGHRTAWSPARSTASRSSPPHRASPRARARLYLVGARAAPGRSSLHADAPLPRPDLMPRPLVESEAFVRTFSPDSTLEPGLKDFRRRGPKCSLETTSL
jgi:hypothetical protein